MDPDIGHETVEFKKPKYLCSLDISNGTICGDIFAREKISNVCRIRQEFSSFCG
jgi:hypothetical protein